MNRSLVRSLAAAALATGAILSLPVSANAATPDSPAEDTTHASASIASGTAPMLGYWVGGGTLALVGGAVAVGTTVRRHRRDLGA